jgi:CelD/BcsL family acetyltransferase involved in cellulose biosynthesis
MSAIAVDVISDYATFAGLDREWNDTVDRAGHSHPFLRHEWLRTWWDAFGSKKSLNVLVVRAGGRILGIAPLMLETVKMYGIPVRRIQFLHNDHTPKADVIVAERPDEVYAAVWKALLDSRRSWDLLQLSQLPSDSPTTERVSQLAARQGYPTGLWRSDVSPYLELSSSWNTYFDGRAAKMRQNIRNRLGRLTKIGDPRLEMIGDRDGILSARADALNLEASGWKKEAGTAIHSDPEVLRFYTELADRAATSGWLRLLFLTVNGQRIATSYSSCYQGRLSFFKTGYDPNFSQYAPFKLLTYFTIRDGYADGLREVDFLGDAEPWKLEWTSTTRPHDWLFVFGNSLRSRAVHTAKYRALPAIKAVKRMLGR